jgi:hypothetical protein
MASINPKATHMFTYDINVYMKKGKKHFCAGNPKRYMVFTKHYRAADGRQPI